MFGGEAREREMRTNRGPADMIWHYRSETQSWMSARVQIAESEAGAGLRLKVEKRREEEAKRSKRTVSGVQNSVMVP